MIFPLIWSNLSFFTFFLVSYRPLASELLDKKQAKRCYRCSTEQPKQCYRAKSHRSKMYVTAVQIAEFLIVVVILMSLPKLVTS